MADSYVDLSFGTGAMKCTPAHDPNDFALAKKYGFPMIKVLDETAHMNDKCGIYQGMDRYECRKALVEKIKEEGHLVKIEKSSTLSDTPKEVMRSWNLCFLSNGS